MQTQGYAFFFLNKPGQSENDLEEYLVFAYKEDRAKLISLAAFCADLDRFGWTGEEWERFEASERPGQLEAAVTSGKEGIGIYDAETGWRIITVQEMKGGEGDDIGSGKR